MPRTTTSPQNLVAVLPPFMPIPRACEVAAIGRSRLYVVIGEGLVRAVKSGTKTLIDTASLLAYLESLPAADINPSARDRRKLAEAETAPPAPLKPPPPNLYRSPSRRRGKPTKQHAQRIAAPTSA